MSGASDDPLHGEQSLEDAVDDALAGSPEADRVDALDSVDYRWLGIGLRHGLERPEEARRLLELIGAREAWSPSVVGPGNSASVPARSELLARAAAVPASEWASLGRETTFGWAATLSRNEVMLLGRVVHEMLAGGATPDIGRGFGLAWDAEVRLPRQDLDTLFHEFTELRMTVAGVLAGRDMRSEPAPRMDGFSGFLEQLVPRTRPGESQAAATLESSGEPGRLGLIATWNVWMAMRYRTIIPPPTFELLVQPWTTVIGSLPEQ